jgi:predicted ABC-type transport system involved in lysophospholipase L1 biosynthesis ATPase subunit
LNREEGITLIVITHDPNVARRATRVLTLIDGRVTETAGDRAVAQ